MMLYLWLFILFAIITVLYVWVYKVLRDQRRVAQSTATYKGEDALAATQARQTNAKLIAYVACFIIFVSIFLFYSGPTP